ncbi:PAS domain S-box protein [Tuwongella immobilis]|uniref:histidine kinase n=1 Tax=Tuwongella immobilis TaxID=692036 RepID=A0A6C2YQ08_9BACT|nr:PAS domain S-box protein [Tuwongella immobilis]VIP03556.1 pas pac sensor hybrid histidine kinase : PAS/PAC sensor hybrid histidine kinase OS=Desulfotignum phosphitoxidans DSM 13687 GN=Dpo_4c02420 PE=4 SV=1: PAS_2: GAF: PHY: PAS_9: PAS_9: PAS_3: PAS_3: PAS_4: HisKA: HATPase_c: Response_reg [Tuwongella immobilis]VTS04480.1 pas pac sensor hybrid histidine kinase : PAS/PAC sensor hybrid histidine kinase OS=Desulfotignum phosphitoxidans DSM 13687 GN=Dpo_4c02420 PE=4 SV=1: PAS_2: GAF: PHY: PAS_9: PA
MNSESGGSHNPQHFSAGETARELLHLPGCIQPFGMLLAWNRAEELRYWSENAAEWLQISFPIDRRLTISDCLPSEFCERIRHQLPPMTSTEIVPLGQLQLPNGEFVSARIHRVGELYVLEANRERHSGDGKPSTQTAGEMLDWLRTAGKVGMTSRSIESYCDAVVNRLREQVGCSRLLISRFDLNRNRSVIAESVAIPLESWFGYHFSGAEIPEQAVTLMIRARERIIEDIDAPAIPLQTPTDAVAGVTLDLSLVVSRSPSPFYVRYFRKLGVQATLVASIIRDGQLWGLVEAHHDRPWLPDWTARQKIASFAELVALQAEIFDAQEYQSHLSITDQLFAPLLWPNDPPRSCSDVVGTIGDSLLNLVSATGFAAIDSSGYCTWGRTPGIETIVALGNWLSLRGEPVHVSDCLSSLDSQWQGIESIASGLLAVSIANHEPGWLMWFRGEEPITITWAGDPPPDRIQHSQRQPAEPGRVPECWVETRRHRSRSWTNRELRVLRDSVRGKWLELRSRLGSINANPVAVRSAGSVPAASIGQCWPGQLRLLQSIVESVREMVLVLRPVLGSPHLPIVESVNSAFLQETGYERSEVEGKPLDFMASEAFDSPHRSAWQRAISEAGPARLELRMLRKTGDCFWADVQVTPVGNSSGSPDYWVVVFRNVTQQKQAQTALCESEAKFRMLAETMPDPIFILDPFDTDVPFRILYVNSAVQQTHGYHPDELIGTPLSKLDTPGTYHQANDRLEQMLQGNLIQFEAEHRAKNGSIVPMEIRARLIRWEGRTAILGIDRDIRGRKQQETELIRSRELLNATGRLAQVGGWSYDLRFQRLELTEQMYQLYEYPSNIELTVERVLSAFSAEDRAKIQQDFSQALNKGTLVRGEYRFRTARGNQRWISILGYIETEAGVPIRLAGTVQDVTRQHDTDRALRASEERLQLALDSGRMGMFDWDIVTNTVFWSRAHFELFDYPLEMSSSLSFEHWFSRVHPEDQPRVFKEMESSRIERRRLQIEYRILLPDGRIRWCVSSGRYHANADGTLVRLTGVIQDTTQRKEAELALQQAHERYRLLADTIEDMVYRVDETGEVLYISPSCERLLGFRPAELLGRSMLEWVHSDDHAALLAAVGQALGGKTVRLELRFRRANGDDVSVESVHTLYRDQSGVATVLVCSRDISQRQRLESQVRQSQKLEAIGQLAGGVAHDFNNLLTVVNGCAELLLDMLEPNHPAFALAREIQQSGMRGAALTQKLLAFSRQQMVKVVVFDPNSVIADMLTMLRRLVGEQIQLRTPLGTSIARIRGDVSQFEQMILNLVVNARDAMQAGGVLSIETGMIEWESDSPQRPTALSPGLYFQLQVRDNGSGMSPEVQSRIFEPFFTTKAPGKGTGLGLAMVYGFVRQANGEILVESKVGQGTTFSIYWPVVLDADMPMLPMVLSKVERPSTALILLVEDDEPVRILGSNILQRHGYRVVTAASGKEALALCRSNGERPAAVLCDVIMPEMGGREVALRLQECFPDLRIGFLSGYTQDTVLRHGIEQDQVPFLQKPYSPQALIQFVQSLLSRNELSSEDRTQNQARSNSPG